MTRDATEDGRVPSAARPRPLPDIIWIRERPDDYLVDDEYLISTHEPIFGNPEDFVRKAKTDPLAAALRRSWTRVTFPSPGPTGGTATALP